MPWSHSSYLPGHPQWDELRDLLRRLGATSIAVSVERRHGQHRLLRVQSPAVTAWPRVRPRSSVHLRWRRSAKHFRELRTLR